MKKSRYDHKPEPILIQCHAGYVHVRLALNPVETESPSGDGGTQWEADTHEFWEQESELDLEALLTNPEAWLCYIPLNTRQEAKDKAQQMLDSLRNGTPVVPVPSYREGAAVCNRPGDKINLLAGLQMGGLPYYELASGEVVELSLDELKAIATDVTAAETRMQQAKQQCWAEVEAARSETDIASALGQFAVVLSEYASEQFIQAMNTSNKTSWLAGLLSGWGIRESWAKIIAGSIAGALAAAGFLTGCTARDNLVEIDHCTIALSDTER